MGTEAATGAGFTARPGDQRATGPSRFGPPGQCSRARLGAGTGPGRVPSALRAGTEDVGSFRPQGAAPRLVVDPCQEDPTLLGREGEDQVVAPHRQSAAGLPKRLL